MRRIADPEPRLAGAHDHFHVRRAQLPRITSARVEGFAGAREGFRRRRAPRPQALPSRGELEFGMCCPGGFRVSISAPWALVLEQIPVVVQFELERGESHHDGAPSYLFR